MSLKDSPLNPERVLVVGGGPSGLVALRNMIDRGRFAHVELYERRDDIGGVWREGTSSVAVSCVSRPDRKRPSDFSVFFRGSFPFATLHPLQPFPSLVETHAYLSAFAKPYLDSGVIKLNREVVRVEELQDRMGWKVISRDWSATVEEGGVREVEETWDAVVIAVGWYDNPVWPKTEGLDVLREHGLARHAKWWRGPSGYECTRNLVVGNANSSNDIAAQLAPIGQHPVYQSIRRPAFPGFPSLPDDRIRMVAPVSKYTLRTPELPRDQNEACSSSSNQRPSSSAVKFDALLSDGTVLETLDFVHLGTGYRPFPSFVHVFERAKTSSRQSPSSESAGGANGGVEGVSPGPSRDLGPEEGFERGSMKLVPLVSEETIPNRVPHLHRLIMYAHNISLGFVGAPMVYTPFTIADVVSTWLALAWRGEVDFPETPAGRLVWEQERLKKIDDIRSSMEDPTAFLSYNVMADYEQEYGSTLRGDIVAARPGLDEVLTVWSDERTQERERMLKTRIEALEYARDRAKG